MSRSTATARRALLAAAGVLVAGAALTGCLVEETHDGSPEERAFPLAGDTLTVDTDNSRIVLVPDASPAGEVAVTRTFEARRMTGTTGVEWSMEDDTLRLRVVCEGIVVECDARHEIRVPAGVAVTLEGRNGDVAAESFDTALDLTTRNGDITVRNASAPLELDTRNGRISATGVTSPEIVARTHNGGMTLTLDAAPRRVETVADNGGTTVEVPDDGTAYRVATETDHGDVDVDVARDDAAPAVIDARSHNGGITLRTTSR
ncbi:DUF4097 family beta strand repeat-containing protein [Streptomyces millisiae]|uniref:DUF4097 family beta strand repeat-containing protein n=1 Tax=Streptomyces millisiae TaxID=3075542 RepID=A0ABU2LYX7_9ACTN|nr:DUF4097 family beta strand repeat-containing protein [Streptomyces sp. DSM 44918]MDT0322745.1 DUF4097 family beta strand repeat-containing protein [Streptomyces sp. DSM 44918]